MYGLQRCIGTENEEKKKQQPYGQIKYIWILTKKGIIISEKMQHSIAGVEQTRHIDAIIWTAFEVVMFIDWLRVFFETHISDCCWLVLSISMIWPVRESSCTMLVLAQHVRSSGLKKNYIKYYVGFVICSLLVSFFIYCL